MIKRTDIIQADLSHLNSIYLSPAHEFEDLGTRIYGQVLLNYLQGSAIPLSQIQTTLNNSSESNLILLLTKLRIQIRGLNVSPKLIEELKTESLKTPSWRGESLFVIGSALVTLKKHKEAQDMFNQCFLELEHSAPKKALKALHNKICMISQMDIQEKLISEFQFLIEKAVAIKEFDVAGIACMNISREYQLIDSYDIALKYIDQALNFMTSNKGSRDYYIALLHRAHLNLDLKKYKQSQIDLNEARISSFPEVIEACKLVENWLTKSDHAINSELLTPTWKERHHDNKVISVKLGEHECLLLKELISGPKTRYELIHKIYSSNSSMESLENRLKNLIARVRRKFPNLIINKQKKYTLTNLTRAKEILSPQDLI